MLSLAEQFIVNFVLRLTTSALETPSDDLLQSFPMESVFVHVHVQGTQGTIILNLAWF